eukprot:scaffold1258_cov190-Pinguiococcus_pyrenoidosus.AAC.2
MCVGPSSCASSASVISLLLSFSRFLSLPLSPFLATKLRSFRRRREAGLRQGVSPATPGLPRAWGDWVAYSGG